MEPNKPKFRFRLNLFDSIVLVLALAVGAFLVWSAIKPAAAPAEGAVSAAGTVQYTIRFQKMIQGVSERIKPGDQLVDTVKNYELGTVVSVETVPAQALIQDHEDKAFVLAGIEGYEDALVTVEAPYTEGEDSLLLGGGFKLRVGVKKIIDRNGRLFGFISVIDLLVIVVVAVMGFALYTKNTQMAITSTNTADQTITYQILASGIRTYVAEAVREGDQLFDPDRSSGGTLGTITDIQLMPGTKLAEFDDGTVAAATVEDGVDMLITVEGTGLVSESGRYTLNRVYELGVNSSRTFCTKYAEFIGTVTEIF